MSFRNNAGLTDDDALAAAIAASVAIASPPPASAKRFVGVDQQIASIVVGTRFSEVNTIAQRVGFACKITLQFPESDNRSSSHCM